MTATSVSVRVDDRVKVEPRSAGAFVWVEIGDGGGVSETDLHFGSIADLDRLAEALRHARALLQRNETPVSVPITGDDVVRFGPRGAA